MSLQSFTRRIEDLSTEQGFQFVFYCDFSDDGYRTKFIPYEAAKKAGIFRFIDKGIILTSGFIEKIPFNTGKSEKDKTTIAVDEKDVTRMMDAGSGIAKDLAEKYGALSAKWHKEHDAAFERGQEDAKGHLNKCSVCKRWACEYCFDEKQGVCNEHSKATSKTGSGHAKVRKPSEVVMVVCPKCEELVSPKKFCAECGAKLQHVCRSCGELVTAKEKFCGNCGKPLSK